MKKASGESGCPKVAHERVFTSPPALTHPILISGFGVGFVAFPPNHTHCSFLIPRSQSHRSFNRCTGFFVLTLFPLT